MEKELIVLAKSLRGHIARWAVQQSPYPSGPEWLGVVLKEATRRFYAHPNAEAFMGTKILRLPRKVTVVDKWLQDLLFDIPHVQSWNERKNGRLGLGFTSVYDRHDERDPDDDFIDLYALTGNVASSLLTEDDG